MRTKQMTFSGLFTGRDLHCQESTSLELEPSSTGLPAAQENKSQASNVAPGSWWQN